MVPREPLPTIWEAPDALWDKLFLPLLTELDPPSRIGRVPERIKEGAWTA